MGEMIRIKWILWLTLIICLSVFFSCPSAKNLQPNVILISIDTLRADHVGIYGYQKNTTPNIDQIAREGIYFSHAFTTSPWTLPAHISLFTGLPPSVHMVERQDTRLNKKIQTIPEIFQANGYSTGGIITLPFVAQQYGFSRGFDYFKQRFHKKSDIVTDEALSWISANLQNPFFLFLHYCDVHWPFAPPQKYAQLFGINTDKKKWHWVGKHLFLKKFIDPAINMPQKVKKDVIALYDGEIAHVDYHIGRLFDYLKKGGLKKNTIVIITSDHGEEFKEHQSFGHGHHFYSEVTKIPIIIHFPLKITAGVRVKEAVSLLDLPLTILKLAQLEAPAQFKKFSIDLQRYFKRKSNKISNNRPLVMESMIAGPKCFALIQQNHKYFAKHQFSTEGKIIKWIQVPESMFNIYNDPDDQLNLLGSPQAEPIIKKYQIEIKRELNKYINKYVYGLQLIFSTSGSSSWQAINFSGTVRFDNTVDIAPFGINLTQEDFIQQKDSLNNFNIVISPQFAEKKIYFILSEKVNKMTIKIQQKNQVLCNKTIKIPFSKEIVQLFQDKENKFKIYLKGSISSSDLIRFNLRKKEKEQLKTLGYINQ